MTHDRSLFVGRGCCQEPQAPLSACRMSSPTQYAHVVGTQQALVAVRDSIGATNGAEFLGAEQHLFAFLIRSVGKPTAVHLSKECTARGWRKCFMILSHFACGSGRTKPPHSGFFTATEQTCIGVFLGTGKSFLPRSLHAEREEEEEQEGRVTARQPPTGINQQGSLMLSRHHFAQAEHGSHTLTFSWPIQCISINTLSFSTHMDSFNQRNKSKDLAFGSWKVSQYFVLSVSCFGVVSGTIVYCHQFRTSHI